jgi:hypothetical protein
MIVKNILTVILCMSFVTPSFANSTQTSVVTQVAEIIRKGYVDIERGKVIADTLTNEAEFFNSLSDQDLATLMTARLRGMSGDLHFRLVYGHDSTLITKGRSPSIWR